MERFGKPSGPLIAHKASFFTENDAKLDELNRLAKVYAAQPRRTACKNCEAALGKSAFSKAGVEYAFCPHCGHLNGVHQDTDEFCASLYTEDSGQAYGTVYAAEDIEAYEKRVADIYLPKARFLAEGLEAEGLSMRELSFADLGAGSGYFVAALLEAGAKRVAGYEVSAFQVDLARAMLKRNLVERHELDRTAEIAATVEADVVSMIGVLEHLQNPREVMSALVGNERVGHVFISVPLFSPCVFFEMAFPGVMPRQLSGGHTHLYTESSLEHLCREFGLEQKARWWFGTDLVDLYRGVMVTLGKSPEHRDMCESWEEKFKSAIDDMQLALDKRRLSSEVHMLLRIKR
ncbi:MAG: class I SAM-dependent methyltransferase [Thermodesulfobacteriota bacterium]|nr:class I SAM-dependent methyltransferase [Thermodesulfobacteriota bacterium]